MPETDQQRTIRRGISHWLTAQVNEVTGLNTWQGGIRLLVLQTLHAIDDRFDQLRALMWEHYHILKDQPLVDFYMKGGNAFKVSIDGHLTSGGDSDWDTQVVFDAWAPMPIVEVLGGLVEDIALDELRQAGIAIAQALGTSKPTFAQDIAGVWVNQRATAVHGLNLSNYDLTLDEPQTVRRIFDHDRLGLWFHSASPLRDKGEETDSKLIPGLVFNDSIKPFILYRMGYTWHAELVPATDRNADFPQTPIAKPILMELIDVTIPRLNTVEAVEVWDAIATEHITVTKAAVGFDNGFPPKTVELPFPDIYYHLGEQLNMLCEIADGSSRHQDKLLTRFKRLKQIYDSDQVEQAKCEAIISLQAGVPSIVLLNTPGPITIDARLYGLIAALPVNQDVFDPKQEGKYTVNPADPAYRLGVLMMMQVVDTTAALSRDFLDGQLTPDAKQRLIEARTIPLFESLSTKDGYVGLAMSDDLVYMVDLNRIGYLQLEKVGLCGIDPAALCRVSDETALHSIGDAVTADWAGQDGNTAGKQYYNTARENGYSFECVCVLFSKGKPSVMLTLTTASPQELPFAGAAEGLFGGGPSIAPLVEVARQRKMAASLIRDYAVRTALSKQYEAGKESIAVT